MRDGPKYRAYSTKPTGKTPIGGGRAVGRNAERTVAGGKTAAFGRRVAAESLGGSATTGVEDEKTSVLTVATFAFFAGNEARVAGNFQAASENNERRFFRTPRPATRAPRTSRPLDAKASPPTSALASNAVDFPTPTSKRKKPAKTDGRSLGERKVEPPVSSAARQDVKTGRPRR